jgi:lipopolysaccharide/colanic/teichoic acid biosynthesis glycosyltransferase
MSQRSLRFKKDIMYKILKRFFDIILALLGLVLLSPLLIPVMIILRLTGEGEVFYLQKRIGYLNRPFRIIKFATMLKDSPNIGTGSITLRGDPRVLPFGRFLRKTKINELPQLINVLNGSMSLVGPRPQMQVDLDKFPPHLKDLIYRVKPGITGIGSIVFRDEEKWISAHQGDHHVFYREHIAPYKAELEMWYQKHASLLTDFLLLFATAWVVVFPSSNIIYRMFSDLPDKALSAE